MAILLNLVKSKIASDIRAEWSKNSARENNGTTCRPKPTIREM